MTSMAQLNAAAVWELFGVNEPCGGVFVLDSDPATVATTAPSGETIHVARIETISGQYLHGTESVPFDFDVYGCWAVEFSDPNDIPSLSASQRQTLLDSQFAMGMTWGKITGPCGELYVQWIYLGFDTGAVQSSRMTLLLADGRWITDANDIQLMEDWKSIQERWLGLRTLGDPGECTSQQYKDCLLECEEVLSVDLHRAWRDYLSCCDSADAGLLSGVAACALTAFWSGPIGPWIFVLCAAPLLVVWYGARQQCIGNYMSAVRAAHNYYEIRVDLCWILHCQG
ncbi:MAG: hypothetical protein HRF50_02110 [Phycisphaerae bacterium]|jgi:hypothetical protein